jgi:hypothetical protein
LMGDSVIRRRLGPDGSATCSLTSLGLGDHEITAAYEGDANFAPSTATVHHRVQGETVMAAGGAPNPAFFGRPVALTAVVVARTPGGPAATGTVVFAEGDDPIGSSSLDEHGRAVLQVPSLAVGTHGIVASFGGNDVLASGVDAFIQAVERAPTTLKAEPAVAKLDPPLSIKLAGLRARLTRSDGGEPVPGQVLTFFVADRVVGTGTTDTDGIASTGDIQANVTAVAARRYRVEFRGSETFVSSADEADILER